MAVTVTKKAAALLTEAPIGGTSNQPVLPEVIDEFLALERKIDKHDEKIKLDRERHAALKAQIVAVVNETEEPEAKVRLTGTDGKGIVEVSGKSNTTAIIDMEKAKKLLGTETFFKVAKIGIADLKAYLKKPDFELVTATTLDGARRLKIVSQS